MPKIKTAKDDLTFDIGFYESVLRNVPNYPEVIEALGGLYTRVGRVDDGLEMDRRLVDLWPENATAHYNLGCSLALKSYSSDAVDSLRRAVELGYDDVEWMRNDPDLKPLHDLPEFRELLERLGSN